MSWQANSFPPKGTWCWVSDGKKVWIAKREQGGWYNHDTWEDFYDEVRYWIPIERPEAPETR